MIEPKRKIYDTITNTVSTLPYEKYLETIRQILKLSASSDVNGFKRISFSDKSAQITFRCSLDNFKVYMGGKTPYEVNDIMKMGKITSFFNAQNSNSGNLVEIEIQI